jgi:hypothetical protein
LTQLFAAPTGGTSTDEGQESVDQTPRLHRGKHGIVCGTGQLPFPTTIGAYDRYYSGGPQEQCGFYVPADAFMAKMNPVGEGAYDLEYSTYLGGTGCDLGTGIALTSQNTVYITGKAGDGDGFPLRNAYQPSFGGGALDVSDPSNSQRW